MELKENGIYTSYKIPFAAGFYKRLEKSGG
jgi:hypothetical protein